MAKPSSLEKRIRHLVGKAIHRYGMIQHGDRILVAVSGGKDSLVLLKILAERLRWIPTRYELIPVYLEMGYNGSAAKRLEVYFREQGFSSYHVEQTDYARVAHSEVNRENPCFLCARLRRKRLFSLAVSRECNKIALGHNQDDAIETLFLNIFFSATISTMQPVQPLFGGTITLIRPLCMIPASTARNYAAAMGLPVMENACPSAENSKRTLIRNLLQDLYRTNRKIRGNIFHALHNVNTEYLSWRKNPKETPEPPKSEDAPGTEWEWNSPSSGGA